MSATAPEWTRPYLGIQHLSGRLYQVTVVEYSRCAEVYMLSKQSAHPFTATRQAVTKTIEEARQTGERWWREFHHE